MFLRAADLEFHAGTLSIMTRNSGRALWLYDSGGASALRVVAMVKSCTCREKIVVVRFYIVFCSKRDCCHALRVGRTSTKTSPIVRGVTR